MTPADRTAYHDAYDRWLTRQEVTARRVVLRQLRVMLHRITTRLGVGQTAAQLLPLLPTLITEHDHALMLQQIYLRTGVAAAGREYDRLMGVKASAEPVATKDRDPLPLPVIVPRTAPVTGISFFSQVWQERMLAMLRLSTTARRITLMTDKTRILVRDVLLRSVDRNWSIPQTVKAMAGVLGGGLKARKRAKLIALTETTRAANAGHEAAAYSSQIKLQKVWIATADTRTRDAHRVMLHSKPIELDATFMVGGRAMRYPGDPNGGAANCVRCRCCVAYIPAPID